MLERTALENVPEFRQLVGDCKFVPLTEADCASDPDEDVAWLFRSRAPANLRKPADIRVLDFGCGRGRLVGQLRRQGFRAYGVDVDRRFIESGSVLNRRDDDEFPVLSVADPQSRTVFPDACFDIIVSDQVLEHVSNLSDVAGEMGRLLVPGGVLLLMFPAKYRPVECHYFLPFVHWLPKRGIRLLAIRTLVRMGLGVQFNRPISSGLKADAIYRFSVEHTFYRPRREIAHEFAKVGIMLDFDALPQAKFARKFSRAGFPGKVIGSIMRLLPAARLYSTFRACLPVGKRLDGNPALADSPLRVSWMQAQQAASAVLAGRAAPVSRSRSEPTPEVRDGVRQRPRRDIE